MTNYSMYHIDLRDTNSAYLPWSWVVFETCPVKEVLKLKGHGKQLLTTTTVAQSTGRLSWVHYSCTCTQLSSVEKNKICFTAIQSWCKLFNRVNQQKAACAGKEEPLWKLQPLQMYYPFPANNKLHFLTEERIKGTSNTDWSIPNMMDRLLQLHTWSMWHFQILNMGRTVSIPSFAIDLSKLKRRNVNLWKQLCYLLAN